VDTPNSRCMAWMFGAAMSTNSCAKRMRDDEAKKSVDSGT
jgi:hypothetical protein